MPGSTSPIYANIILKLASEIDELTQTFVFKGYCALANALAKPLGSLCVLYIVLLGFSITRGLIQMPMQECVKTAMRIGLVYMLAMDWGYFSNYVVTFFVDGMSELSQIMMGVLPTKIPMFTGSGVNGGLQSVFTEIIRVGHWVWNTGSFRNLGPYFSALMIYVSGIVVVGLAFFELVVAKLMLSICLCTAPLFIALTLFDKTRTFFDHWLGKVVGFSLVMLFVSTVLGFCMHLLHWCISTHFTEHAVHFSQVDWIPLLLCACLDVMAIFEVVNIAKSIGGSCCTSSGSSMMGSFVGGSFGALSAKGMTRALGGKTAQLGKHLMPAGPLANLAQKVTQKAVGLGGQGMKAIQARFRGRK